MTRQMCAICGESPATTTDHIPPKGIYPKPRPKGLHTVPCCARCNNSAGPEDEEFKVLIGFGAEDGPRQQDAVIDSIAKTVGSNRRIAEQIFSTKRYGYAQRGSSVFEPTVAVSFDRGRHCKVITRHIRALYWRQTGKCLGKHTCAGSAGTGERALRVSVDAALRAGIFKASGSIDPIGFGDERERGLPRPWSSSR